MNRGFGDCELDRSGRRFELISALWCIAVLSVACIIVGAVAL